MLAGTNVALGVTGSIAAVRTVELAHELQRRGASVRAVTTDAARSIVHPWALEFATGSEPVTELTGSVEHVELCGRDGWADVLLIAPATANTLAKVAATVDDTPVTTCATTALGADVPVVVAPAMHEPMYDHPGLPAVVATLEDWGVTVVDPRVEEGKAKIATDDAIALATARAARGATIGNEASRGATSDDEAARVAGTDDESDATDAGACLSGESIVVTAGATAEPIDPVRVLTNRSSGRMGRAVARACYVRGADVTLVHGPVGPRALSASGTDARSDDPAAPYADLVEVEDAGEMLEALEAALGGGSDAHESAANEPDASESNTNDSDASESDAVGSDVDALVAAAAVGDYTTPAHADKLRSGQDLSLDLEPTPKLIDGAREIRPDLPIVGFKTETSGDDAAMVEAAREIADRAALDLVVANDASVMGAVETRALFVDPAPDDGSGDGSGDEARDGSGYEVRQGTKAEVGADVADRLARLLADGRAT